MTATSSPPPRSTAGGGTPFGWRTLLLVVLLIALPFAAPHAPARLKLIGLFPLLVGLVAGVLTGRIGARLDLSRKMLRLVAVFIVPLVMIGFEWESARSWQATYREEFIAHVKSQPFGQDLLQRVRDGTPAKSEALRQMHAVYRDHLHFDLDRYLRARGKLAIPAIDEPIQLPASGTRWLIGAEVLLAILAGLAVVFWQTRGESK